MRARITGLAGAALWALALTIEPAMGADTPPAGPATATPVAAPAAKSASAPATAATAPAPKSGSAPTVATKSPKSGSAPATSPTSKSGSAPTAALPAVKSAPAPRATKAPAKQPGARAASDTAEVLRGGQEGTVFRTLTVEGEDRIRIDFERPDLKLDLDPESAPGLEPEGPLEMLVRGAADPATPLLAQTAREASPFLAHPWLSRFADGAVATFEPQVKGLDRWQLIVADSRGQSVASFQGRGDPPRTIAWDGITKAGTPALPGLTYSHAFEAWDRAGNKRSFVGEGFEIPPYRLTTPAGPTFVFSAAELTGSPARMPAGSGPAAPSIAPILIEAAGWINHSALAGAPLRMTVTARSAEQGRALASDVSRQIAGVLLGDPARLETVVKAEPDAPAAGTVMFGPAK